jgi:hypothetical protein
LPRASRAHAPRDETFIAEQSSGRGTALPLRGYLKSGSSKHTAAKMTTLGQTRWAIAEGYIPAQSSFSDPVLVSHETACILNAGDRPAHVRITVFFADREPVGPYGARCTCVSTISSGPNRFHAIRPTHHYSSPMCRSWCSTRGSIRDTLK